MCTLTPPAHAHVYILEKSQHKVPEEALKVSNSDRVGFFQAKEEYLEWILVSNAKTTALFYYCHIAYLADNFSQVSLSP